MNDGAEAWASEERRGGERERGQAERCVNQAAQRD